MHRSFPALLVASCIAAPATLAQSPSATLFQPLTPCRLLDTRLPAGPLGAPALQPGVARSFNLAGVCGVPAGAVALSVNATVTTTSALGQLVLYASDIATPGTSNLSFGKGQTRASESILALAADGSIKALAVGASTDFILDVSGYFFVPNAPPPPTVTLDAVPDQTIPTNTTLSLRLGGHSTDALAALTYDLLGGPSGATVSPLGVFAFSPSQGQLGAGAATVRVRDGGGRSAQRTFQISIVDHDHAPVFGPLPDDLTRVGASYAKTLTATDPDAGDVLTFTLVSGPAGMTLTGATLSWTPAVTQLGNWPVRVKVTDRAGLFASGQFNVAIQFLVATDDVYSVTLGQILTVNAPGVLANDLDPLAGPITAAKLTNPDKGTLNSFGADGSFVYQAPPILPGPPFVPAMKWHLDGFSIGGIFQETPLVLDVDGDGKPELIVLSQAGGFGIMAVRGTDGTVLWSRAALPAPYNDCTMGGFTGGANKHIAAADIDDSGHVSIVFPTSCGRDNQPTGIVGTVAARYAAINAMDGTFKWLSAPLGTVADANGNHESFASGTTPTLARLRPGETPSILVGRDLFYTDFVGKPECDQMVPGWPSGVGCRGVFVLDGKDGSVRQRMAAPYPGLYPPDAPLNGNGTSGALAADLDGDGSVEIIYGGAVWNNDGSVRWNNADSPVAPCCAVSYWNGLGNFDDTPDIEVVRLNGGGFSGLTRLSVYKPDGTLLWAVPVKSGTVVGIPAIADVDGTGRPSVVFSVDANVCALDYKGNYKWCHDFAAMTGNPNLGSQAGLQVFDLDGDGVPEVIVPIPGEILVFLDGATGNIKATFDQSAANGPPFLPPYLDYPDGSGGPIVADVDGSGHAAIVSVWGGIARLDVVKSAANDWRPARKAFNQDSYQFGNINDDGSIPKNFFNNFATQATNVFRNQGQVLAPVDPLQNQTTSFTYTASDGPLTSAPGKVTITILPPNRPPKFTTSPPTRYSAPDFAFTYAAHAVDPDPGDTVTYSIKATEGNYGYLCTMDPASGVLSCPNLNSGDQAIVIVATDNHGASGYQTILLRESLGPGAVPNVVGQQQLLAGLTLSGAGFGAGSVTKIDSPAPAGEVVQQTPGAGTIALKGSLVDLVVSKGPFVPPPPGPPPGLGNIKRIVVTPASTLHVVGDNVPYKATSVNNDGTGADITAFVTWSSSATGVATVNAAGVVHAAGAGTTILTATAGGLSGQASLTVAARANADFTPPTAIITQPASGGTVTGLTQILGTATDTNFLRYELALEASGDSTFNLIGQGTTAVINGVLGTLDPTLLLNGAYTLRLTVFDANGNSATADVPFVADGSQKVGNFTLSYTDMTVPLAGIPIQITRTYDSRDKHSEDFGVGWSLGIQALRISASGIQGTNWQVIQQGTSYVLVPGSDHFISVSLPNGRVESFDLQVSPNASFLTPFTTLFATFVPRAGTLGHLQSLDNVNLLILDPQPGPVTLVDDTSLNTFHPDQFLYTQLDGTQFVVRRTTGVQSVKDPNGNQITISAGGISHSSGASLGFTRDGSGRITGITDPTGHTRAYAYSAAGDLASATDRAGNTTRYFYDAGHGLVRVEDPLGKPGVRCTYDDQGRLVSITDASGNATTYVHDLAERAEQVVDALGRTTVIAYDDRGNVLAKTDPLGHTTSFTYDGGNNVLTVTTPLGFTRSWTYDSQNNVIADIDALGRTTTFTRDAGGRPLTTRDPLGHMTQSTYDASGNLVVATDALGHAYAYARDVAGNVTALTAAGGGVTQNAYDTEGHRTQMTDVLGTATTFQYDGNGNLLTQQGSAGPSSTLSYDPDGRIVGNGFGALQRTIAYDAAGQVSTVTAPSILPSTVSFDDAGHLTSIANSSGVPVLQQTYDAVGNTLTARGAAGDQLTRTYDAANRLVSTQFADGSLETRTYDADGRVASYTDPLGHTTAYQYDAAGQAIAVTDALGGTMLFTYDANGNRITETDPAGHVTSHAYDALNREVTTTWADGTSESTAYDADGRIASRTDAAGNVTTYSYDALGQLLSVTDSLGHTTHHAYQVPGLRTSTTDANGNVTSFAHDAAGRLVQTTRPLGATETFAYDSAGKPLTRTNGSGETLQYQYDAQGRAIGTLLPGGATETYTFTADQLVSSVRDASGTTFLTYDPTRRRLVRVTQPDGRYVRYAYDAVGNRTLVAHGDGSGELVTTYAYDALDRLVTITDPNGGITVQTWDAAGNLASVTRPNGVKTTTAYDARNRPVTIVSRDSGNTLLQQHSYTLDALGNRTRVDAFDGSHVDYQYDALSRIVRERHFDASAVLQLDLTYGYDPAGNVVSAGPTGAPVSFTFDADNELVSGGGVTYTYDLAGRRVQESFTLGGPTLFRKYAWDAEDRLTSFQDTSGATTTYAYDGGSVRQSKGGATGAVSFLVDRDDESGYSQLLRETSPSGTNTFVRAARLLETVEAGTSRYHLFDGLGSTRFLTGAGGAVSDSWKYQAWGQVLSHVGGSGIRHLFAGEETDLESGLTYLRARYYDPRTGSFLTRDTQPGDLRDPLSLHPYLYASGNPVNWTDPSGHETLAEVLVASQEQLKVQGQNVLNLRKGIQKANEVLAETLRVSGGVLAVEAFLESMQNPARVTTWFGGGKAGRMLGKLLTGGSEIIGQSIDIAAEVLMAKVSFDMLGGKEVSIGIEGIGFITSKSVTAAVTPIKGPTAAAGCAGNPTYIAAAYKDLSPQAIELCGQFFRLPLMPNILTLEQADFPSAAGVMVHEFTHLTLRTRDHEYGCGSTRNRRPAKDITWKYVAKNAPGANLFNADTYRCWAEDTYVHVTDNPFRLP